MHASENPAQRGFFRCNRKAREGAIYSRQDFRSNGEVEMIPSEERRQDRSSTRANNRVRARIGGIRGRVANLRKPIRVRKCFGGAVRGSLAGGSHPAPEVVPVLSLVESDQAIGKCQG